MGRLLKSRVWSEPNDIENLSINRLRPVPDVFGYDAIYEMPKSS